MASKEHAGLMREYRQIKKNLGMKEFRAYLLPDELKLFQQMLAGAKLQRRLNGMPKEFWE